MLMRLRLAPGRVVVPGLVEAARPEQVFRLQRLCRRPPGDRITRQQQRLGKMLAHQIEVVDDDHHRPLLAVPALDQRNEVGDRPRIDRVERLVEQDDLGVLHQHARKQRALQLAARQRVDRARLEPFQADRHQCTRHRRPVLRRVAAEQSALRPQAHRDEVDHPRRKAAVELRLLRQIGDLAPGIFRLSPAIGFSTPTMPFISVDLPEPLAPTIAVSDPVFTEPLRW